jgi:hypothetical protein
VRLLGVLSLVTITMVIAGCSKEEDYTDQQRLCIARQYSTYDRKKLDQCVQVCKNCFGGNTTTCTTSCRLNGAL